MTVIQIEKKFQIKNVTNKFLTLDGVYFDGTVCGISHEFMVYDNQIMGKSEHSNRWWYFGSVK